MHNRVEVVILTFSYFLSNFNKIYKEINFTLKNESLKRTTQAINVIYYFCILSK